jgi:DNA repair protein RadC
LGIKKLPISERPYEKLEIYGPDCLSNSELLAIIIKTGTKNETSINLAMKILNLQNKSDKNDLRFLIDISIEDLKKIKGIGRVKAIQIKAVSEIAKRISKPINIEKIKITNSNQVAEIMMSELRYEKKEIAKVIILNTKNIILRIINISLGSTNFACIEPKEVLTEAIKIQASKIILIHNHPSGDPTPSKEDFRITDRIYECANLMGIELLDHIIIGDGKYKSILNIKKE